jgi:GntR family transcriptional regulator
MGRRAANTRRPLYLQVAEELEKILQQTESGSYLPSEPALAKRLGVSRATLREAMRSFEERGWILRRQGVGTVVTRPPQVIESGLEVLESLEVLAERKGLAVKVGQLEVRERPPEGEEAEILGVAPGEQVVEIARTMLASGRPVAYLVDVLRASLVPKRALRKGFRGSVLDLLLERAEPALGYSRTEITAVAAPQQVARQLKIQRGDVLLLFDAYLFSKEGAAIDHSYSYFLPGIFRFHVLRRVGSKGAP